MDIKGVIYQFPYLDFSAVYIGETVRILNVRLAEHKRAVRMKDVNNSTAVHNHSNWPLKCLGKG